MTSNWQTVRWSDSKRLHHILDTAQTWMLLLKLLRVADCMIGNFTQLVKKMQRDKTVLCALRTSIRIILSHSLPRCSCDDLYWIWIFDDISSSLWLRQYRIQHARGLICNPVVNDYLRCVPVRGSGHKQWEWLLHNQSWNGKVCVCLYACVYVCVHGLCDALHTCVVWIWGRLASL